MDSQRLNRVIIALNNDIYRQFPLGDPRSNYYGSPVVRDITIYVTLSNTLKDTIARDVFRDV